VSSAAWATSAPCTTAISSARFVYRFDDEWLFTVVTPPVRPLTQCLQPVLW